MTEGIKSITVDISAELSKEAIKTSKIVHGIAQKYKGPTPQLIKQKQLDSVPESKVAGYYEHESVPLRNEDAKPWRKDPHYFKRTHVSLQALIKMTLHARLGGPLEIMGMLTGKHIGEEIIVTDCFPLPVHGTESRVNPLNEAYEFMLRYLSELQENPNRSEHVIGWYHSHPSFGCWLSGIDVQTQRLNQNFQDPYVAIVIDPEQTIRQRMVEIGCFRTYYEDNKPTRRNLSLRDYGAHAAEYYSLDVDIYKSADDDKVLKLLEDRFWFGGLCNLKKESLNVEQLKEMEKAVQKNLREIFAEEPEEQVLKIRRFNRSLSELSSPNLAAQTPRETEERYTAAKAAELVETTAVQQLREYFQGEGLEAIFN